MGELMDLEQAAAVMAASISARGSAPLLSLARTARAYDARMNTNPVDQSAATESGTEADASKGAFAQALVVIATAAATT